MESIRIVAMDLDNTIYNWVDSYVPSFLAMVAELSRLSGVDPEELKASFKRLHERYRTTEYTFAIQQLDVLRKQTQGLSHRKILEKYAPAIHAFREVRSRTLQLYPSVIETLTRLRGQSKLIVAVTDSMEFHAEYRLNELKVSMLFDALVCPPDHGFPEGTTAQDVSWILGDGREKHAVPNKIYLSPNIRKPKSRVLRNLLNYYQAEPRQMVYIGDSLTRDIIMAQRCGVIDVHAQYGRECDPYNYGELLKITYWTEKEMEEDRRLRCVSNTPTFVVECFSEVTEIVETLDCGDAPFSSAERSPASADDKGTEAGVTGTFE